MASPPFARQPVALMLLLVGGFVAGLTLQVRRGENTLFKDAAMVAFSPFLSAFDAASRLTREGARAYVLQRDAALRAERLEAENRILRTQLLLAQNLARENLELRNLLKAPRPEGLEVIGGRALTQFGAPFGRYLLISCASPLSDDTPVISSRGVVGRVRGRAGDLYRILAVTDPSSALGVCSERTGARGVAVGSGDHLAVRYVSNEADVQVGDVFVTSGEDGIFPPGLRVGATAEAENGGDYLKRVRLDPSADLRNLAWVLVLRRRA